METIIFPSQAILETERLLLKELNTDILQHIFNTMSGTEIMSYLGLSSMAEVESEHEKLKKGYKTYRTDIKSFLLVHKETGKAIGRTGYHNWYQMHSRAEIGYAMSNDENKGKGYMKEALKPVIAYGFNEMKLNRIEAFISPTNTPSLRLINAYGFTKEGILREHYCYNGIAEDSVCFSLLRSEYQP